MLSFAYKWHGEKRVRTHGLCDYPGFDKDHTKDKALCRELWKVFDEADILVAHNGDRFDIRKANARFLVHGFKPPAPYKSIDTLKIARRHFKLESNRLDHLGQSLGVGRKLATTGWRLWEACMKGDRDAFRRLKQYNAQDVRLLESVYEKLAPWHPTIPDKNLWTAAGACPNCQSSQVQHRGFNVSRAGHKPRFQCQSCGHWWSGAKAIKRAA